MCVCVVCSVCVHVGVYMCVFERVCGWMGVSVCARARGCVRTGGCARARVCVCVIHKFIKLIQKLINEYMHTNDLSVQYRY